LLLDRNVALIEYNFLLKYVLVIECDGCAGFLLTVSSDSNMDPEFRQFTARDLKRARNSLWRWQRRMLYLLPLLEGGDDGSTGSRVMFLSGRA
jgi:hypothetical protein